MLKLAYHFYYIFSISSILSPVISDIFFLSIFAFSIFLAILIFSSKAPFFFPSINPFSSPFFSPSSSPFLYPSLFHYLLLPFHLVLLFLLTLPIFFHFHLDLFYLITLLLFLFPRFSL